MDTFSNQNPEAMAYDLRQRYAKIVGDHLEEVADARRDRNYPDYFRALENLHTVVKHKFKEDKKSKKEKETKDQKSDKDKKEELDTYSTLKNKLVEISHSYTETWNGTAEENAEEIAKIEKALRDIEEYIYKKMDEANMFGSKRDQEGLT